jgi:4-aminobutyrate aminotransferase-like enzyme
MITTTEEILNDPEYQKAKADIITCVKRHQSNINGIKKPDTNLNDHYLSILDEFKRVRGGGLYYPYISTGVGNGPYIQLRDGSIKLDCINGIGVHYCGHSHQNIIASGIDAAIQDTVMEGHLQQGYAACELMKQLTTLSKKDHCFISTSGATACENALKIAFQHRYPSHRVLAFEHCFMGRTTTLSQVSDKPAIRQQLPLNLSVDYVPFYDSKDHNGSIKRACKVLKRHLSRYPNEHAVMVFELIQGEGGINVGHHDFFKALIQILKEHQVLVFADEVQTFLRTPKPFASDYFGILDDVDIISIGKASQVCATLYNNCINPKPGLLSQTFTASSSAIMASIEILRMIHNESLFGKDGKIANLHAELKNELNGLHHQYPNIIGKLDGCGTMCAVTVFGGDHNKTNMFSRLLYDNGLISFVAGKAILKIRMLLPALVMESKHVKEIRGVFEQSLRQMTD